MMAKQIWIWGVRIRKKKKIQKRKKKRKREKKRDDDKNMKVNRHGRIGIDE